MRVSALNTYPGGVATQDPELGRLFAAEPEHVTNFMRMIAQEVRALMAQLGFRQVNQMIGRADRLEAKKAIEHWKARGLDFSKILHQPEGPSHVGRFSPPAHAHPLQKPLTKPPP